MSVTADATMLKAAFKAVATQMETVKIFPDEDGWRIFAISTDKISMADVRIPRTAFKEYEVWEPVVIDTRDLLDPLSKAKGDATIDISTGRLVIRAGGLRFTRAIMGDMEVAPRMPDLKMDTECIVPMQALEPIMSAPIDKVMFKAVRLAVSSEGLAIDVHEEDSDIGAVSLSVAASDCLLIDGDASASYSAERVFGVLKAVPGDAEADLRMRSDFPLQLSYSVGGAEIMFMLAPRVAAEEDA